MKGSEWSAIVAKRHLIDTLTKPGSAREVLTPEGRMEILTSYLRGIPVCRLARDHHIGRQTIYQITGQYRKIVHRSVECGLDVAVIAEILGCSPATLSAFAGVDS